jgi:hypothetical protein
MTAIAITSTTAPEAINSRKARIAGVVLSTIAVLFLGFDTAIKLIGVKAAVEGTALLGFRAEDLLTIGLIEVVCLVLYLVPRTAVLGAVLWTGYFGGAIATHLNAESPLLTHTVFPIYVAALIWGGLYLRDPRVRALVRARHVDGPTA